MKCPQNAEDAGDPPLHVGNAQAIQLAVFNHGLPRILGPPPASGDGIEMPAEVHALVGASALAIASQDVDARMPLAPGVTPLCLCFGDGHELHLTIELARQVAGEHTELLVVFT